MSGTGGGFERFCRTRPTSRTRPARSTKRRRPPSVGTRHRVHRVPGRRGCPHGRGQHGERLGGLPDGRPAEDDLGAQGRGQDHELEPGRSELPGPGACPRGSRHGLGNVRLLHRRDQRRGGAQPRRLHAERGRQRHRPGGLRRRRGASATSGTRTTRRIRTRSRRSGSTAGWLRRTERRQGADGSYAPLSASALHLREAESAEKARVRGFVEYFLHNIHRMAETLSVHSLTTSRSTGEASTMFQSRTGFGSPATVDAIRTYPSAQPGSAPAARRRRWGEVVIKVVLALLRARLGSDDGRYRRALLCRRSSSFARSRSSTSSTSTDVGTAVRAYRFGVVPLLVGHLPRSGPASSCSVRPRCGDLSQRVRQAGDSLLHEAARGSSWDPDRRLRLLALTFFTPLLQDLGQSSRHVFNALWAGLVMGVMLIPIVASVSEDAMSAVPRPARWRLRPRRRIASRCRRESSSQQRSRASSRATFWRSRARSARR